MKINRKYVNLLQKSYEKYKKIDVLKNNCSSDTESELSPHDSEEINTTIALQSKYKSVKNNAGKSKSEAVDFRTRFGKSYRPFLENEDEILLEAVNNQQKTLTYAEIKKLSKKLNRNTSSVRVRIDFLMSGKRRRTHKSYTLKEDTLIIDYILKKLKTDPKDLRTVAKIYVDMGDLGDNLGRTNRSLLVRWVRFLLPTILSYQNKTLDLDIRMLFLNYLADSFDDLASIDWDEMLKIKELSGQTDKSLKWLLSKQLDNASEYLDKSRDDISLQELAEAANDYLKEERPDKVRAKRKIDIIDYFENECVKRNMDIKQFML